MTMRVSVRLLGLVAAFCLLGVSQAEAKDRCAYAGAKTLRQTSKVRLYVIDGDRFYVCVRSNGRRFRADDRTAEDVTMLKTSLTTAGSYAAYAYTYYRNEDVEGLSVVVLNLKTGKKLIHVEQPDAFSATSVSALVLHPTATVAWIFEEKPISGSEGTRKREIHTARTGEIRTLDSGLDIDVRSLRLQSRTLYWTKAGVAKTATLD